MHAHAHIQRNIIILHHLFAYYLNILLPFFLSYCSFLYYHVYPTPTQNKSRRWYVGREKAVPELGSRSRHR